MAFFSKLLLALFVLNCAIIPVFSHGDHDDSLERREFLESHYAVSRRSLEKCSGKLTERSRLEYRLAKRNEMINNHILKKRAMGINISPNPLHKRQTIDHVAKRQSQPVCILAPEVTVGPYYVPSMLIRPDITEGEPGIELLIEMEVVDVNTCEVIPNTMVDFWHCNSTGIYSGFAVEGTVGETFNRGLQPTDANGIVTITTTFPGWYRGRATHIHIATHHNGAISNGIYTGGTVSHIGQLFFPEDILDQVDVAPVYNANTVARLLNANDSIFRQQGGNGYDAITDIELVGCTLADGVIASITLGVDLNAERSLTFTGGPGGPPPAKH